jgi:glucokinase
MHGSVCRLPLDSSGSADAIIGTIVACADALCLMQTETLAVAIPGPFDYRAGIARFAGVGKFACLAGVDLRRALLDRLAQPPGRLIFVNDADAFGLGEWLALAAGGYQRLVAITLGTGIGSAFIEAGQIVSGGPSVPPDGRVYQLVVRGQPLEDTVSRRAIIAAYRHLAPASPPACQDVRDIAAAALSGDRVAVSVFEQAFSLLGEVLVPWLIRFRAQVLAVGGGLSASWALINGPMRMGLGQSARDVVMVRSANTEDSIASGRLARGDHDHNAGVSQFRIHDALR